MLSLTFFFSVPGNWEKVNSFPERGSSKSEVYQVLKLKSSLKSYILDYDHMNEIMVCDLRVMNRSSVVMRLMDFHKRDGA